MFVYKNNKNFSRYGSVYECIHFTRTYLFQKLYISIVWYHKLSIMLYKPDIKHILRLAILSFHTNDLDVMCGHRRPIVQSCKVTAQYLHIPYTVYYMYIIVHYLWSAQIKYIKLISHPYFGIRPPPITYRLNRPHA